MSSYIDRTLSKDERVLLETRIALRRYFLVFVAAAAIFLFGLAVIVATPYPGLGCVAIAIAVLMVVGPIARYYTNELALTNRRVIAKFGILSLRTLEIRLEKIESVSVHQSIFGRIFDYGSVVITGTGGSHDPMPEIPNPVRFRARFAEALDDLSTETRAVPRA